MKDKRVLVIGSAIVDLIFQGEIFQERWRKNRLSLAYGGKYVVDNLFECFGGGGANAAVSLARQGFEVYLWSRVANDKFGQMITENLEKEKVKLDLLEKVLPKSGLSAILLDMQGRRTIVNFRGGGDELTFGEKVKKIAKNCQWLALFSLPRWPKKEKLRVLKYAKEKGLKVFLSLHGDEYRKGLSWNQDYFQFCDILDLNVYELAVMLGRDVNQINFARENFSKILKIPLVLVTHDKKGSHLYTPDKIFHQKALSCKKLDTTGAGDAFCAGFLGKYIKTSDLRKSFQFAVRNATAEIEVIGAQTGLLYDR